MTLNQRIQSLKQDEFDFIIKNGVREDSILGYKASQLIYLPFSFVKSALPSLADKNDFTGLILKYLNLCGHNVFEYEIEKAHIKEAFKFICWIFDEYNAINRLEKEYLTGDPDFVLLAAGVNRLNQFGDFNIIDCLAGGDILKHDLIKAMPYNILFDKQLKNKIDGEIQKKYQEIQTEMNKSKNKK